MTKKSISRRKFIASIAGMLSTSRPFEQAVGKRAEWRRQKLRTILAMEQVMGSLAPHRSGSSGTFTTISEEYHEGFKRLRIAYNSEPGDQVPAYLLVPDSVRHEMPAVLCLHQTTGYGKDEPAGLNGDPGLFYGKELAQRGFVCIIPDYPFLGENRFDPYAHSYRSCSMKGIVNHLAAVDLLCSLSFVNASCIGVIGHSLGGHNALFAAAFDDRIKAIVTSCGFTSFQKYNNGDLTGWSGVRYMPAIATKYDNDARKMPFDFSDILSSLAPRPVFISAPTLDDNFDVTGVRDCVSDARAAYQQVFRKSKRLVSVFPDAGHEFPADIRAQSYGFLERYLKH